MNIYKYIGFLNEKTRPLTIFEFKICNESDIDEIKFNNHLSSIIDHINSMSNRLKEGRDYIICNTTSMNKLKVELNNKKSYMYYDSIMSVPGIRKAAHEQFYQDINSNSKIKIYFESKLLPYSDVKNFTRQNRLLMVNINKRKLDSNWSPREYRHTTPEFAHMQKWPLTKA